MADYSRRSDDPELMDDAGTDYDTFRACLVDLERVNRLTLAYRPTLAFLERLRRERRLPAGRPLAIVDVGSGHGDMLRLVARWAARRGIAVRLTGVDLNPWSARAAREVTPPGLPVEWLTSDIFAYAPPEGVDLVISSLFTHHLPDPALVRFVAFMEATARLGWFVNDLHRHPLPHWAFRHAARLMRMHRFVQHDGPVSIRRGFVAADWRQTLAAAGVPEGAAEVRWRVPFRLCVTRIQAP